MVTEMVCNNAALKSSFISVSLIYQQKYTYFRNAAKDEKAEDVCHTPPVRRE